MCNEAYRRIQIGQLREGWSQLKFPLRFPEGIPNFAPLDSIRIIDRIEIVRAAADAPGEAEMVTRRWSWPAPGGKRPVYNVRSDGRALPNGEGHGRCLIPVDGFYEFTAPPPPEPDLLGTPAAPPRAAKKRLKSKWAFTLKGYDWFAIAGVWRRDAGVPDATGEAEMVTRRWSWPAPGGKRPVYNIRSDGRALPNGEGHGRCLIPVDGFYEFTDPSPSEPDLLGTPAAPTRAAKNPLKSKWAFTLKGHDWFAIAGVWRRDAGVPDATGEAWAMLTCPPGLDIAPYHDRQVVVPPPADFAGWLTGETPAADLCQLLAAGSLEVMRVR